MPDVGRVTRAILISDSLSKLCNVQNRHAWHECFYGAQILPTGAILYRYAFLAVFSVGQGANGYVGLKSPVLDTLVTGKGDDLGPSMIVC